MAYKTSILLKRCFWILFILCMTDVLFTAFYDIFLGYTGNYPEGFTWGEYTSDKTSLFFVFIIPLLTWIIVLLQLYFSKFFTIKSETGKKIIPIILIFITLVIRLIVIGALGLHTHYNSDVREAIELANKGFPFDFDKFSSVSSWAIWPVYLKVIKDIFGSIIVPGLILNAVYISLSVGLLYWIILKMSGSLRWAVISAEIYIIWPMNFLFSMSLRPENVNIFLLILSLSLIVLCQEAYKKKQYKHALFTFLLSACTLGIASFFKKIDLIELIALAIIIFLSFLKTLNIRKRSIQKSALTLGIIFIYLFVYKFSISIGYSMLDTVYVQKVNRNPTAHYIEVGLSPWSDGSFHGMTDDTKPIGVYRQYAKESNYDYKLTSKRVFQKLINEISTEKNLSFVFFQNKLRICMTNQAYINFISDEASDNCLVNRAFFRENVYPLSQIWYSILLIFLLIGSLEYVTKESDYVSFYSALFIFGFILLMLICETQPRYKYAIYPYMSVLAGKGMLNLCSYVKQMTSLLKKF